MALYTKTSHGTATFQVEPNTAYHIILKGAGGGGADNNPGTGGSGHKIEGVFANVGSNTSLQINVGQGGFYSDNGASRKNAFNGGGMGGNFGGGGGGATDIRIGGTALNNRIFIAGGGGGSADTTSGKTAGHGGYPNGQNGITTKGGTQTSGGTGYTHGSLGKGGDAPANSPDNGGGGGGLSLIHI